MTQCDSKKTFRQLLWFLCVNISVLSFGQPAQAFLDFVSPAISDLEGGIPFKVLAPFNKVRFGGEGGPVAEMTQLEEYDDNGVGYPIGEAAGMVPAGLAAGPASLEGFRSSMPSFYSDIGQWFSIEETFLYVDAPLVDSMTPTMFSIGPDNRIVTLEGAGFPTKRGVEVWVGDVQAELVLQSIGTDFRRRRGELIQFRPPPFPGGEYPLTMDVRVVTVGGGETVLEDAFTYDLLLPEFTLDWNKRSAWKSGQNVYLSFKHVDCDEELEVHFDGESAFCGRLSQCSNIARWGCVLPNHPPGYITVTVIDSVGNSYSLEDGFRYTRSSPLHSADRNGDGVVSLSELLRVVQFYNEGGYRCAPEGVTTEDGFLPGPGAIPEDCRPHDSDLIDWDWQVDLSELLETIQLYNFGPYTLCADQVFFCPAG